MFDFYSVFFFLIKVDYEDQFQLHVSINKIQESSETVEYTIDIFQ